LKLNMAFCAGFVLKHSPNSTTGRPEKGRGAKGEVKARVYDGSPAWHFTKKPNLFLTEWKKQKTDGPTGGGVRERGGGFGP